MSRTLDAAISSRLDDRVIYPVMFVQLEFQDISTSPITDRTLRLHTDLGNIAANSLVWTGTGDLGHIGPLEETLELGVTTVQMTLSAVDSDILDEAVNEDYQDRDCTIYLGLRDAATGTLVGTGGAELKELWFGQISEMPVSASVIELTAESELALWNEAANLYFTDQALQANYPGDLAAQFVGRLRGAVKWPNPDSNPIDYGDQIDQFEREATFIP